MNDVIFYKVLQIQSLNAQSKAKFNDDRIKKDFYGEFMTALTEYNFRNGSGIKCTTVQYEDFFQKMLNQKKLIKTCCSKYKVN